jgi:ABC-type amino acid transport substrate-binding protein
MSLRLLRLLGTALISCLALVACGGTSSSGSSAQNGKPAGADKTNITDWTDPRPASWNTKYPLFAPVQIGDGSLKRVQDSGRLLICAEINIPPISYVDPKSGEVVGYEPDLAAQLVKGLGIASYAYVDIPFASIIPALQANKCDIDFDGISIKSSRASAPGVKYTAPFIDSPYDVLYVPIDSNISTLADLKGKSVATQAGTVDDPSLRGYIDKLGGGITVRNYTGQSECLIAVVNKTVDACFLPPNAALLAAYPKVKTLSNRYIYLAPPDEAKVDPYNYACEAIITKKADGDLNLAISLEMNKLRISGAIGAALDKWNDSTYDPPTDPNYTFIRPGA